ncbi:ABC transporter substrate-binding protein [Microvirga antarctica]|uniref:ABC transporter substrate-binding protein n=1 Tax=Microvirga antarctica TaxID=2819233 RepID=UPI001FE97DEA|nr:ABC transporter substrate-binding protein [Microvirga antarctica]
MKTAMFSLAIGLAACAAPALAADPNTVMISQGVDASTLDPAQVSSRNESNMLDNLFGTLYKIGGDGKITPYLAKSYKVSDDGTKWTFTLNDGLTCQDGEKLTAEDAAYSFNRAADPAAKFTGNTPGFVYSSIQFKKATALNETDVEIEIGQYNPIALGMISEVYVHCKDSYSKMNANDAARKPVGSGPYKFVEWTKDDRVVFAKNENFKLAPAKFDKVVWRTIPEGSTRVAEMLAGNLDIITNVSPDQKKTIDATGAATVVPIQGTRRIYVGFNQKAKFQDTKGGQAISKPEVRRALQYAVDVPTICSTLLGVECTRATSPVNAPNNNTALQPFPFDPARAEKLLDEAGYPKDASGTRFELTLQSPNGRYYGDANVAMSIGQFFSDIGVKTKVTPMEWASVYQPLIRAHDAGPLFFLGTGGDTWSAAYDLADFSAPTAGTNYTDWNDPVFFGMWKELYATRDPVEQKKITDKMSARFSEQSPWLMLYFQPNFYGVAKRIGWQPRRDERIDLADVTLK